MITPRIIMLAEMQVEEKIGIEPYASKVKKCQFARACLLAKAINDLMEKDKKILEEFKNGSKC